MPIEPIRFNEYSNIHESETEEHRIMIIWITQKDNEQEVQPIQVWQDALFNSFWIAFKSIHGNARRLADVSRSAERVPQKPIFHPHSHSLWICVRKREETVRQFYSVWKHRLYRPGALMFATIKRENKDIGCYLTTEVFLWDWLFLGGLKTFVFWKWKIFTVMTELR